MNPSWLKIGTSICSLFLLVGCGGQGFDAKSKGTLPSEIDSSPSESSFAGDPVLQASAIEVLTTNCASCHDQSNFGGVTNILDVNHLVNSGLVTPGDEAAGRLIGSIEDGSMPQGGALSDEDLQALKDWIVTIQEVEVDEEPPVLPPVPEPNPVLEAKFASINQNIIQPKCLGCHNANNSPKKVDLSSYETIIATGKIMAGNANASTFFREVDRGMMPKRPFEALNAEEVSVIADWINNGALND